MVDALTYSISVALRELSLFAAIGFFSLGIGDLAVDFIWLWLKATGRLAATPVGAAPPAPPGRFAVFVPAWDEADVIGAMLACALRAFGAADFVLYVGAYANDPATIEAVRGVDDARVLLVIGATAGPTCKAECLNRLWNEMLADEAQDGVRFKGVVLHDAEDVVHSGELALFDRLLGRFACVQLPVIPLIDPDSHWIGASYADEFAEAHGKELVVREALGAGLPLAGVGCAIARDALADLAGARGGAPFDAGSLTEDYELGLRLRARGHRGTFARAARGQPVVATRAFFPATLRAAVTQKSRWMTGIALAGWDRLGWSGGVAERWMRLRDRQAIFAAMVLAAAYLSLLLWPILLVLEMATGGEASPASPLFLALARVNAALLLWRLGMRFGFVAATHGWREGLRAMPRAVTSNIVAMMAAARALGRYARLLRTGAAAWGKTAHIFPRLIPAE